ncbi:polysaccharide pyruvyl transferase family protein [Mediterraneibacter faecis]
MKIGIVTIVDYTNYGNRLQNYAVTEILKKRFNCQVVTLVPHKEKRFYDGNYVGWIKDQIVKILCFFPTIAEKRFGCTVTRWANFHRWNKRIPTKDYYQTPCLSASLNKEFDYFFAGSDQIWNYNFSWRRFEDYFLEFAENRKKIAICGSFGVEEIPEKWKQIYYDGLSDFSHISVREDAGQTIIKKLLDRDVPVLIDPVMMLSKDEWLKVAKKPRVNCLKPYVLKYYLGDELEEEKIDTWAKQNGYEVYELMNEKVPELYSAGPGEFISLISKAALVCSDSFHCIAFSIIFSIPFVVYARQGEVNNMISRLNTLLEKFGFQNRWNYLLSEDQYLDCDYGHVKYLLEKEQKKFVEYVSNILR